MKCWLGLAFAVTLLGTASSLANDSRSFTAKFDEMKLGTPPPGWPSGFLGSSGNPHWVVDKDPDASSSPHVLRQDGNAPYAWIVHPSFRSVNGTVEARFKILSGKQDPEAGVIWRFKDAKNYYYVRANIIENNVVLYRMRDGKKEEVKSVDVPVPTDRWHRFKVGFLGDRFSVSFDGKDVISLQDTQISGAGGVGLFSMADTNAEFDDFSAATR